MAHLVGIELKNLFHEVEAVKAFPTANDTKLESVVPASSSNDDGLGGDGTYSLFHGNGSRQSGLLPHAAKLEKGNAVSTWKTGEGWLAAGDAVAAFDLV